jgi:hypothetical protein
MDTKWNDKTSASPYVIPRDLNYSCTTLRSKTSLLKLCLFMRQSQVILTDQYTECKTNSKKIPENHSPIPILLFPDDDRLTGIRYST